MCIVIWFLLKLVLKVGYINGCNWIVWLDSKMGLNVWIFKWCNVGVWFNKIGCFKIILFKIFYIICGWCCNKFLVVWIFFILDFFNNVWIIKGWNNFNVILWGKLYWCKCNFGFIIIIEWLE